MDETAYEAAGGAEAMSALAHAWRERCLQDEVVSHLDSADDVPDGLELPKWSWEGPQR